MHDGRTRGLIDPAAKRPQRRGSVYILVLICSALVGAICISAIAVARINSRSQAEQDDLQKARALAFSAVEAAMSFINANPLTWRTLYPNDTETPQVAYWDGTISWKFIDDDGSLIDNPNDPFRLCGIGRVGSCAWAYSVSVSGSQPLDVLNTCIHAAGGLTVKKGKSLTVSGAPASTNGSLQNDGTIFGDVEAVAVSKQGTITGTLTAPAAVKQMPSSSVIWQYMSKATQLPFNGDIDKMVLTPQVNEYGGGLNADGVYMIDTRGNNLTIMNSRIHGTLIVRTSHMGGATVTVDQTVLMQPYRQDYPVLLIIGDAEIKFSGDTTLSESQIGHNFNPPGAPYSDSEDTDQSDQYPSRIDGLVHCTGNLLLLKTARIKGVVICEGSAEINDTPQITHDPSIPTNPPAGYTGSDTELSIQPGSWRREPVN